MAATAIGVTLQLLPAIGTVLKDVLPLLGDGKKKLKVATMLAEQLERQIGGLQEFTNKVMEAGHETEEHERLLVQLLLQQIKDNADALGDFTRGQDDKEV